MDTGTSVDPSLSLPNDHDLSLQDQQTAHRLYQKHPQLRADFKNVIDFLNLLSESPQAYRRLFEYLLRMRVHTEAHNSVTDARNDFYRFCIAVGFVEKAVDFYRKIMLEIGKTYVTALPPLADPSTSFDMRCLQLMRSHFLNCTSNLPEFRLRLARSGFLQDLAEDIKHIRHLSAEALENGNVFLASLGTIHNCLRHPDVVPIVRELNIVQDIVPFLSKQSSSQMVKSVALMTLAYIVEVREQDVVRLDGQMVQFFMDNVQQALKARRPFHDSWVTAEVLGGLVVLANNHFNSRLLVAKGAVETLVSVLDTSNQRSEEEKQSAVTLVTQLVSDPVNRQVCKRGRQLKEALRALEANDNEQTATKARGLLQLLEQSDNLGNHGSTTVSELLADQLNMLTILDMGEVEYLMDQLKEITAEGGRINGETASSCLKVLQALAELSEKDPYRREMMARGCLNLIKKVLQIEIPAKLTETALRVVLGLTSSEENQELIKVDARLVALLRAHQQKTSDVQQAQLTLRILQNLQL